jgi:hypothetical protein
MATSPRKARANRQNVRRSTGPRSAAGKRRSAVNAFRHGLALPIETLPEFAEDIDRLARLVCPGSAPEDDSLAREVAAATLDLKRIRQARQALERQMLENPETWLDETVPQFHFRRSLPPDLLPIVRAVRLAQAEGTGVTGPDLDKFAESLRRIERYERRALSRRNAAVRALTACLEPIRRVAE